MKGYKKLAKLSLIGFLLPFIVGSPTSCNGGGTGVDNGDDGGGDPVGNPPSSLTGAWDLTTRTGFGNNEFTADMYVSSLNLTQTTQLTPGYSSDVYELSGNFSGFGWLIRRNSDGHLYALQNASGSILGGAINTSLSSHNLEFYLGSQDFVIRGVAPEYASMWGDVTLSINMTTGYGVPDGVITLTGMWDATRK